MYSTKTVKNKVIVNRGKGMSPLVKWVEQPKQTFEELSSRVKLNFEQYLNDAKGRDEK